MSFEKDLEKSNHSWLYKKAALWGYQQAQAERQTPDIDEQLTKDKMLYGCSYERRWVDKATGKTIRERIDPMEMLQQTKGDK